MMILFNSTFLHIMIIMLSLSGCGKTVPENGHEIENPKEPEEVQKTYTNPVFEPILADPSVVRDPETGYFYAYGTQDDWGDGRGSRLIPIIRSTDLVNWSVVSRAFVSKPSWKNDGGLWAPDVSVVDGKFYLYYSYSTWGDPNPGIGLAVSNDPRGPFIDQGKLFDSQSINVPNSIDPHFYEDNGKRYLFWGSFSNAATQGTYGVELSADGLSVPDKSKKFKIAAGDFEAVMIHKHEGYYYFFGSKGSCCDGENSRYHVLVARSATLNGPYLDKNGHDIKERGKGTLLIKSNDVFAGPGHNARIITDDAGTDWFLYHAIDRKQGKVSSGASRRALMLDKLIWENGWPEIADKQAPHTAPQHMPIFQ